jgi:hypothetical protein
VEFLGFNLGSIYLAKKYNSPVNKDFNKSVHVAILETLQKERPDILENHFPLLSVE